MSLKRGLIEVKSRLYPRYSLRAKLNLNCHQHVNSISNISVRTAQNVKVKKENSYSPGKILDQAIIDTGQRRIHVLTKKYNKRVTAIDDTEPEEHEHLAIEPAVPYDVILSQLKQCSTVEEQMITLQSSLSLSEKDRNERLAICNNIQNMLAPFFDDFKIQMFGSSVNGFGCKGCDIDMSFSTNVDAESVMKMAFDDSEIPSIEDVLSGRSSPQYMSKLAPTDQLLFIHTVFLDYYKDSVIAPLFIRAYIPIVRFLNDKYNLKCDLSTANTVAYVNTKLLYVYGHYDSRVIPLVMAIRYWAKHVGLIGGGLMFNTYTVTLMVIYFLQTRNPPVLPPAQLIMTSLDSVNSHNMNLSNLLQDLHKIPKSENTETLEELFREFFFYYLYFDFTRVICPYDVTAVSRDEFCTSDVSKKFRVNTICVQDPAKLTHNVANLVDFKHCRKFAVEMLAACNLLQKDDFWIPKHDNWGLVALLEKQAPNIYAENVIIDIPLLNFSDSNPNDVYKISNLVERILKYALLFKCEDCLQGQGLSNYANSVQEDGQLLFWLKCHGQNNTWLGRNCAIFKDSTSSDFLERERLISLSLCDRLKDEKKKEFSFSCKGFIVKKNEQSYLHLKLMPFGKMDFSPVLSIFLKEYIPKTIKSLL